MKNPSQNVDERAQRLLKILVEKYLGDGMPVASKALATQRGIDVSSATVRNIMADLETRGLVGSPHTSAGKVPTDLGLRFFVDTLISVKPVDESRVRELKSELDPDRSPQELISQASNLLSQFTQMAGVVTLPKRDVVSFRQVEFLPLSGDRVLVILVVNEREVQNRVIHLEHSMSEEQLHQAANFINAEYVGKPLMDVRESVLASMREDRAEMDGLMKSALEVASKAFEEDADDEEALVVSGRSNLVQVQSDPETINRLYEAFSHKGRILHLLDQCLRSEGIQLFIGEESGYQPLGDMSLVTRTYEVDGQPAGVLGVIGPTRMAYDEIIPVVDVTARLLSAAINYS